MATLATSRQIALGPVVPPLGAPAFGTGMQACTVGDPHGEDFKTLRNSIIERQKRIGELSESILALGPENHLAYNSVPPPRSYFVNMIFERGGEVPPVPFDLDEE